jgi:hypothetical protein
MGRKKNTDKFLGGNENLPISVELQYTEEQLLELKRCGEDVIYFAENFFYIVNLDEGRQKIKLYEPQKRAILDIVNNRRMVICASRQVGKSTLMTVVCLWYALFHKDFTIAILANKEDQAKEILERIKLAYEEIPNYIKSGVWDFTKEQVKLTNGSKIFVSTTSADAIRGKSVNLLFVDEFAHIRKEIAEEFFKSIIPTLSSSKKSKLVIVSTPNGTANRFYNIFSDAETGRSKWAYSKIYWHEIPGRDEAWKREQLDAISYDMNMWNQEFDLHFLEDGSAAIDPQVIERLKSMTRPAEISFDNGEYKIWYPAEPDHIYVFGVDVAEGVGQDWSVVQILDITDPTNILHAGQYAVNYLQPFVFAEKLNQIARAWGRPFLCVESNKEGSQVLDALINIHHYDNIVTYTMKNDKRGYYQKPGIFCHQNSKYTGIMNFKYFIEHLEVVKIFDITTVKEFETFVRKENKTWTAQKGKHDDRVMSMIWALFILEKDVAEQYLNVLEYDDTGKPCRIADPNQDLANMSLYEPDSYSSYAKKGGNPMPVIFQIGCGVVQEQNFEMEKLSINGWTLHKNK